MNKYFAFAASLFLTFLSCNKDQMNTISSDGTRNNAVALTDTVKVPLIDLGTRTYLGHTGGLYPGGVNSPSGQYKKDLKAFAVAIKPLNGPGAVDSSVGKIVFISMGGSTGGRNMDSLKAKTLRYAERNPYLKLINACNGGGDASLQQISAPNTDYWTHVSQVILGAHSTLKQVQVVYLESEDSLSTILGFPARPNQYKADLEAAIRTCKVKLPNLKLIYVLGRTTTFGTTKTTNSEPCPYYNGWGDKFMIADQINGVPGTEYKGANAVAPMVTWAFYQWTNGSTVPRTTDGFVFDESLSYDGVHATPEGQDSLSTRFQNFLITDKFANIWYKKH